MNVNSRGHNLDTRFKLQFPKIKHLPGVKPRWVLLNARIGWRYVRCSQLKPAMGCATYGASNAVTSSLDS